MLRVPLALAVVDDFHRVFTGLVGDGRAGGIDGVEPQIHRDVAVEQIELEIDEHGRGVFDFELEPVEAGLALVGVFEVIHIVGRAIHITSQHERIGMAPVVVGLGFDGCTLGGIEFDVRPFDRNWDLFFARRSLERDFAVAVLRGPEREIEVGVTGVQVFLCAETVGTVECDLNPILRVAEECRCEG